MLRELSMKIMVCLVALAGFGMAPVWAEGWLTPQGESYVIQTPAYRATVEADGCLTSLKVGDKEFLNAHLDLSRGCFLVHEWKPVQFQTALDQSPNTLTADSPLAAMRYVFEADAIAWTVENKTTQTLPVQMIPSQAVEALSNGAQEFVIPPVCREWTTTSWFIGKAKMTVTGGTKLWGPSARPVCLTPGDTGAQIWEATLGPRQRLEIRLTLGAPTEQETQAIDQLLLPEAACADLTLFSPKEYQVFQRQTAEKGRVALRGQVALDEARAVRFRFVGKDRHGRMLKGEWTELPIEPLMHAFDASLDLPAGGWYECEVQALGPEGRLRTSLRLGHVGVGEVFVGAGQSNSTNWGQGQTRPASGMVSTFSGSAWRLADDPQPGCHDFSAGGSFWPSFGDAMAARWGVPVGVAVTGQGGSNIAQWKPGLDLFNWSLTRMEQLGPGGFRAVLWHQGESDVFSGVSGDEYFKRLRQVIVQSRARAGWPIPWFVANVSHLNPYYPTCEPLRKAQQRLWEEGIALEGPDTDLLIGDNRDADGQGAHFCPKGLKAHGQMWSEKVSLYLEQVVGEQE